VVGVAIGHAYFSKIVCHLLSETDDGLIDYVLSVCDVCKLRC
jgi:hypothetical protein